MFDPLAALHSVDVESAASHASTAAPGTCAGRSTDGPAATAAALTDDVPDAEDVMAWLAAHQPSRRRGPSSSTATGASTTSSSTRATRHVRAVLDWEMATVGDPLMDLGASLAYWVQADDDDVFQLFRRQPTNLPGMPTRAEVVDHYLARTGLACRRTGASTRSTGCSGSR